MSFKKMYNVRWKFLLSVTKFWSRIIGGVHNLFFMSLRSTLLSRFIYGLLFFLFSLLLDFLWLYVLFFFSFWFFCSRFFFCRWRLSLYLRQNVERWSMKFLRSCFIVQPSTFTRDFIASLRYYTDFWVQIWKIIDQNSRFWWRRMLML